MKVKTIGFVGCGNIATGVAMFVDKQLKNEAKIIALTDIDQTKAKKLKSVLLTKPGIYSMEDLVKKVDLVVEAASVSAASQALELCLKYKKDILILSVGALVAGQEIIKLANQQGIKIYIPAGAICGTDGLAALSLGGIRSVSLVTSKPPQGLVGAQYLKDKKIDLAGLNGEKVIFKGTVQEAIKYFPKNINVAVTLLLASGFDPHISVIIKASSKIKRNIHCIEINAKEAKVKAEIENVPSIVNPRTSALAILSAQAVLKKMFSSLKIGG